VPAIEAGLFCFQRFVEAHHKFILMLRRTVRSVSKHGLLVLCGPSFETRASALLRMREWGV
jgi:hypothetical protein